MFLVNFAVNYPLYFISKYMEQLRKYTWLIEKIRMAGKNQPQGSVRQMGASRRLQRREAAPQSHVQPLARGDLQPVRHHDRLPAHRGYLYYISNPEEIDDDLLKKWMLDSFAVGNTIGEHLSIKDRIVVDEIPLWSLSSDYDYGGDEGKPCGIGHLPAVQQSVRIHIPGGALLPETV